MRLRKTTTGDISVPHTGWDDIELVRDDCCCTILKVTAFSLPSIRERHIFLASDHVVAGCSYGTTMAATPQRVTSTT